mmetsp:Transcript_37466/g.105799  ORF Transcript_37466/g.105799 Transcript_37466/m.105799 type:complete len:206 (-) Transcript_37466:1282-1899(-)
MAITDWRQIQTLINRFGACCTASLGAGIHGLLCGVAAEAGSPGYSGPGQEITVVVVGVNHRTASKLGYGEGTMIQVQEGNWSHPGFLQLDRRVLQAGEEQAFKHSPWRQKREWRCGREGTASGRAGLRQLPPSQGLAVCQPAQLPPLSQRSARRRQQRNERRSLQIPGQTKWRRSRLRPQWWRSARWCSRDWLRPAFRCPPVSRL